MSVRSAYLKDARIVVIGAGAVGSVIAYRLAQAGANVSIVESRFPGSGATGNSFAWLNSFGKTPRDYHRLNARSIREHQDLARELDGDWVHVDGGLTWEHHTDADRSQKLRDRIRNLHQWGYRVETLDPEYVMRDLEPDLYIDPDLVEAVYYTPNEGWVNGVGLCYGAVSAAVQRYGATLIRDTVIGFDEHNGAIDSVKLAGGDTLRADAIVNAAGPEAAQVARLAGIDLPLSRQPGLFVITEPAPVNLKSVVRCPELSVHHEGGWRLLLRQNHRFDPLAESNVALDVTHPVFQQLVEDATKVIPNLHGVRLEGFRHGVRPIPKDGQPIIGFAPEVSGFYQAVMHSGVTLAATVGLLVAEDFMGAEPPELAPYRPERFNGEAALAYATSEE